MNGESGNINEIISIKSSNNTSQKLNNITEEVKESKKKSGSKSKGDPIIRENKSIVEENKYDLRPKRSRTTKDTKSVHDAQELKKDPNSQVVVEIPQVGANLQLNGTHVRTHKEPSSSMCDVQPDHPKNSMTKKQSNQKSAVSKEAKKEANKVTVTNGKEETYSKVEKIIKTDKSKKKKGGKRGRKAAKQKIQENNDESSQSQQVNEL